MDDVLKTSALNI